MKGPSSICSGDSVCTEPRRAQAEAGTAILKNQNLGPGPT